MPGERLKAADYLTPAEFMAVRSDLIDTLRECDEAIDRVLSFKTSKRAAAEARRLFADRAMIAEELAAFDVQVEPHQAVPQ